MFTPGTLSPLIDLGDHTARVAICAESFQRGVIKDAVERGAQTYLTSHFSLPNDRALRIAGLAIAREHESGWQTECVQIALG